MLPPDIIQIAQYAAPPTVGAFIGYLTNKIAIKMLFRPLNPWYICGVRVPMTPGVIPSKRHELAENMGKMVAEHLLTEKEITKALSQAEVGEIIRQKIKEKGEDLAEKDLGTLGSLLPQEFSCYYDMGMYQLGTKVKESLSDYLVSESFEKNFDKSFNSFTAQFLESNLEDYLSEESKNAFLAGSGRFIERNIAALLASDNARAIIEREVYGKITAILSQQKSAADIVPASFIDGLTSLIQAQMPVMLEGLGQILKREDIRERIVDGACGGVEKFIASMGPMAAMVQNFVNMDTVRQKLTEYLIEKDDDIQAWIKGEEMQARLFEVLNNNIQDLLHKPLVGFINDTAKVEGFSLEIAKKIHRLLQEDGVQKNISTLLVAELGKQLDGKQKIGDIITNFAGEDGKERLLAKVRDALKNMLSSKPVKELLSSAVDHLVYRLKTAKIGKLGRIINPNMRGDIYDRLQKALSTALIREAPKMVESFSLKEIIAEKINSLDLLKLEGLLLSIMEEQFKYINLFGALLGFILGCINLVFFSLT